MTILKPAFAYVRVSTKRQALNELSLTEQQAVIAGAAEAQGYEIVQTFVERGKSARSTNRSAFQELMATALARPRPIDAILVWKFDRFARNTKEALIAADELENASVKLISATQPIADGTSARLIRTILMAVAENESDNNASQVEMVMKANARSGFWNGAKPPLGYRTVIVEKRGKKDKKRLELDPAEVEIVMLIFRTYVMGVSGSGPIGLKSLAVWLAGQGIRHREQQFSPSLLHAILKRATYVGRHYYNVKDSKKGTVRPREEWIEVAVPTLVPNELFMQVQQLLAARNPKMSAARSHSSPVLLSGLAHCGNPKCAHGTMMLMTGKGGQYRYYACSNVRRKGDKSCGGNNVPMDMADNIVVDALEKRLFQPERLRLLLSEVIERSATADADRRKTIAVRRAELTDIDKAVRALMKMVEVETLEASDPMLKERFAGHKQRRLAVETEVRQLDQQLGAKASRLTDEKLEQFAALIRQRLHNPSDPAARKRYVQAFVGKVVMTRKRIIIHGPKSAIATAAFAGANVNPDVVRTSVSEWRARNDSNVRPSDS
jgi:site-specific DNA recombinase